MHGLLRFFLERMRQEGVPLVSYRPVQLSIYASAGHFPVSDSLYLTLPPSAPRPAFDPCRQYDLVEEASALYRCYARFSRNYSTIVDRSYSDFLLKCQDYRSCGGQCIVTLEDSGQVAGYCIYYAGEAQPGGGILGEGVSLSVADCAPVYKRRERGADQLSDLRRVGRRKRYFLRLVGSRLCADPSCQGRIVQDAVDAGSVF